LHDGPSATQGDNRATGTAMMKEDSASIYTAARFAALVNFLSTRSRLSLDR
jgi:hypothetical protein